MKRDLDLIRKMLLTIEESPSGSPPPIQIDGYTDEQIGYHAYLLIDAGLARGMTSNSIWGPESIITSLTWEGHEFLDAARDESRWKKAMDKVTKNSGAITLEVLKQILVSLMKGSLGLPP